MALRVKTPPGSLAVNLDEMKAQLGVRFVDDDALIEAALAAAQEAAEDYTQRRFVRQTLEWVAPSFYCNMPIAGVVASSVVVRYVPAGEEELVVWPRENYLVRQRGTGGHMLDAKSLATVPHVERFVDEPIVVTFDAGEEDVARISPSLKAAIKIMAADLYKFRESAAEKPASKIQIPLTVERLLVPLCWS